MVEDDRVAFTIWIDAAEGDSRVGHQQNIIAAGRIIIKLLQAMRSGAHFRPWSSTLPMMPNCKSCDHRGDYPEWERAAHSRSLLLVQMRQPTLRTERID